MCADFDDGRNDAIHQERRESVANDEEAQSSNVYVFKPHPSLIGLIVCSVEFAVKCDETRPVCSTCDILELTCGGYEISIFFDLDNIADDNVIRFRRPLLTEGECTYERTAHFQCSAKSSFSPALPDRCGIRNRECIA